MQQSNYWREIREDKVVNRQQRVLSLPNPDSVNPEKPIIPGKYNNNVVLNKLKRKKYFSNSIL